MAIVFAIPLVVVLVACRDETKERVVADRPVVTAPATAPSSEAKPNLRIVIDLARLTAVDVPRATVLAALKDRQVEIVRVTDDSDPSSLRIDVVMPKGSDPSAFVEKLMNVSLANAGGVAVPLSAVATVQTIRPD